MADPKYAGLPGIATSEKDVYESGDLPEDDQNWVPAELQSESVETDIVDTKKAFEKFNPKYLIGDGADFSGTLGSKPGYDTGEFCIVGPGETETPTQKLQRLKAEIGELSSQLGNDAKKEVSSVDLISQLESLQTEISLLDVKQQKGSFRNVMSSLEDTVTSTAKPATVLKSASTTSPDKVGIKLMDIEARIASLEKTIGSNTQELAVLSSGTKSKTLREAVDDLKAKQSLLDPENLPQIDTRLQAVLNKLNDINKGKKQEGAQQVATDKKVTEIYDLIQKWDNVCASLPSIINRLEALNELHQQAAGFSTTMQNFEKTQGQIDSKLSDSSNMATQIRATMKENAVAMQKNIQALDQRIQALNARK